MVFGVR